MGKKWTEMFCLSSSYTSAVVLMVRVFVGKSWAYFTQANNVHCFDFIIRRAGKGRVQGHSQIDTVIYLYTQFLCSFLQEKALWVLLILIHILIKGGLMHKIESILESFYRKSHKVIRCLWNWKGYGKWGLGIAFKNNSQNNSELIIRKTTSSEAAPGDFEFKSTPPWIQSNDQEVRAGSCLLSLLSAPTELVTVHWNMECIHYLSHCFFLTPKNLEYKSWKASVPVPHFLQPCLLTEKQPKWHRDRWLLPHFGMLDL